MSEYLSEEERRRLLIASINVYDTVDGRIMVDSLLQDLGLYDEPETEGEMLLHRFAMVFMKKYFGVFDDDAKHRGALTKAMVESARRRVED